MTEHKPGLVNSKNPKLSAIRVLDAAQFKRIVVKALEDAKGDVTAAAKRLNCGKTTMHRWFEEHPELKDELRRIRGK